MPSETPADLLRRHPGAIIQPFKGVWPRIAEDAYVAPGAVVVGDVEIAAEASVWYGCVLRGDDHFIRVGPRSNIQDGTVIHVMLDAHPTIIGADVVVGHGVRMHGCTVEDGALVGIGAVVLDGAVIEGGAMLAAGAVLTPRKRIPAGQLWAGSPAKMMREVTAQEREFIAFDIRHYAGLARAHRDAAREVAAL
ncbi:gamma carbonic anhydrase family protein [Azospirillum thermophilum]|uniref:Gamma carbonic anhydrase family protein n=1 Tax=Azospirillum thermophilum TaxID=2202148 RepID=A0A2S2CY95_9PROT|nr:gamma carbonic anhydrase family protein [Azospirillum thermophilum]AWK89482.1 gamma carbonic anhydrase family protein [Azospirillum thermophilum]